MSGRLVRRPLAYIRCPLMKHTASARIGSLLLASLAMGRQARAQADALPSWNDGPAKKAIVAFVQATTTPGPSFVAPEARIATFDQDGTLWVEHPMYASWADRDADIDEGASRLYQVHFEDILASGDRLFRLPDNRQKQVWHSD